MIQSFKRVVLLLLLAVVLAWGFLFALANDTIVPLDLVFWNAPPQHMSWWLVLSFVAGAMIGWMMAVMSAWLRAARNRRVMKRQGKEPTHNSR